MVANHKSFRAAKAVEGRLEDFAPQYLISFVADQDADGMEHKLPFNHAIETVAVFADVSGFTKLTESLAEKGDRGTEELGFYLNRYFERLVKMLAKSGGDVFKFAGDAMIILWRPEHDEKGNIDLASMACRAAQCGLYLQEELAGANLAAGVSFSIKVGIGAGRANVLHVGGICGRTEYFACGPALIDAFKSESMSKAGDTVVSPRVWNLISSRFEGEMIIKGWMLVKKNISALRNISIKRNYNTTNGASERLNRYVAAAIKPFLKAGIASWCAELRNSTTLFVNLGFSARDFNDLSRTELDDVQKVLEAVQSNVYQLEGSMNKFLLDDKGSTLLAVLGLPPLSHEDDPARGIQLALSLARALSALGKRCYIGVTSGIVLCGPVGSGSRREYSVLGDKVNTSARLMQAASKVKMTQNLCDDPGKSLKPTYYGCILCDKVTANAAMREPELYFEELPPLQLKGKSVPEAIFQPGIGRKHKRHSIHGEASEVEELGGVPQVDPFCAAVETLPKELLVHSLDLFTPQQRKEDDLLALFDQIYHGEISSHVVALEGDVGIGKTATCTRFVVKLSETYTPAMKRETETPIWVAWNSPRPFNNPNQIPSCWSGLVSLLEENMKQYDEYSSWESIQPLHDANHENDWFTTNVNSESIEHNEKLVTTCQNIVKLLKAVMKSQVRRQDSTYPNSTAKHESNALVLIIDEAQFLSNMDWRITRIIGENFAGTSWPLLMVLPCRPLYKLRYRPHFRSVSMDYVALFQDPGTYQISLNVFMLSDIDKLACKVLRTNVVQIQLSTFTHYMSGGNPLFAVKCIRSLLSTKPPRLVSINTMDRVPSEAPTERESMISARSGSCEAPPNPELSASAILDKSDSLRMQMVKTGSKYAEDPGDLLLDNEVKEKRKFSFHSLRSEEASSRIISRSTMDGSLGSANAMLQKNEWSSIRKHRKRRFLFQDFEDVSRSKTEIIEFPLPYRVRRVFATFLDRFTPEQMLLLKCATVLCIGSGMYTLTFDFNLLMRIYPLEVAAFCNKEDSEVSKKESGGAKTRTALGSLDDPKETGRATTGILNDMKALIEARMIIPVHTKKQAKDMKYLTTRILEERAGSAERPEIEYHLNGEHLFRFDCGFLRDVVYKRMLYAHRKRLHKAVVDMIHNARSADKLYSHTSRINLILYRNYYFAELEGQAAQYHAKCFGYVDNNQTDLSGGSMDYGALGIARNRFGKRNSLVMAGNALQSIVANAASHHLIPKSPAKRHTVAQVMPTGRRASASDAWHDRAFQEHSSGSENRTSSPKPVSLLRRIGMSTRSVTGKHKSVASGHSVRSLKIDHPTQKEILLESPWYTRWLCCISSKQVENINYGSMNMSRSMIHSQSSSSFKMKKVVPTVGSFKESKSGVHESFSSSKSSLPIVEDHPEDESIVEEVAIQPPVFSSFCILPNHKLDKATVQLYLDKVDVVLSKLPKVDRLTLIDSEEHETAKKNNDNVVLAPYLPMNPPTRNANRIPTFNFLKMKSSLMVSGEERNRQLAVVAQQTGNWNFDIFEFDRLVSHPLRWLACFIFHHHDLYTSLQIDPETFANFTQVVDLGYINTNYYHNSLHAADVLQTVHALLNSKELTAVLSPQDKYISLIAAIIHDYGHPGVNTAFLVATNHEIVSMYKDCEKNTVLEEFHVGEAFRAIEDPRNNSNILGQLSMDDLIKVKAEIFHLVMATSLANHGKFVESFSSPSKLPASIATQSAAAKATAIDKRRYLQLCIKCADVGNCAKQLDVYRNWAMRVAVEFFDQGDQEKSAGLPVTPLMNRDEPAMHLLQRGFIRGIVHPLFCILADSFPSTSSWYARNIRINYEYWQDADTAKLSLMSGSEKCE